MLIPLRLRQVETGVVTGAHVRGMRGPEFARSHREIWHDPVTKGAKLTARCINAVEYQSEGPTSRKPASSHLHEQSRDHEEL